ncbi:MAG: multicopper oxidase domain-containing protein [Geobacteraceae bacterium]|nr:multicopper oxidase domain-containing protein [Geobacteraceae bacterium]
MNRRDFLKLSAAGVATLVIGSRLPFLGIKDAFAAEQLLEVTITDAVKEMATHNAINQATSYFWIYKMKADGVDVPADCPGPTIVAVNGDSITIRITNALDEPHAFFIPGMFDSNDLAPGGIAPGQTVEGTLTVNQSGAHLYYDNLNEPVNRMMGLHGALVVRPAVKTGNKFTPYDNPTPHIQNMYDDFGGSSHWPGLAWEEGDNTPWALDNTKINCPPFRQYVWLTHQVSPNLFAEVGNLPAGQLFDPQEFMDKFLRDPFSPTRNSHTPQYFTINGQSGFFSHFSPAITPQGRVGEPCVVHILNAGLWTHSMHLHANHFFVTSVNGVPSENPIWVDVYTVKPMERIDYTIPYMRPPDMANVRGIGRPDQPLNTIPTLTSPIPHPVWPPTDEFQVFMPPLGTTALAQDGITPVELGQRMSPLCFPMHDHSEPSQTAQGGNYNMGLISGMYFTGDRNAASQGLGNHMDFPMDEDFEMMFRNIRGISSTGLAAGPRPEPA